MQSSAWRVELELDSSRPDPVGKAALQALADRGLALTSPVRSGRGFLLPASLNRSQVETVTRRLLADPVTECSRIVAPGEVPDGGASTLVVRRLAGVADPEADSARRALALLDLEVGAEEAVQSYRTYRVDGPVDSADLLRVGGRALANPTIERTDLASAAVLPHPVPDDLPSSRREVPLLEATPEVLEQLSSTMALALSRAEMEAIQEFFRQAGREPTDVELETLAQTWSEHCKHKTLTGPVHLVETDADGEILRERHFNNLLKETVFAATQKMSPEWCWSVFKDNAGVFAMTDEIGIAVKVETHNHPSALDPYGGAGTGIGGVIRDILGTGLGARPFAATDLFCVGPEDLPREDLPPGTMHPDRILDGVIAGVRDYGNRMGIPTVCGGLVRHPGYVANPLVFAGCLGEIPRSMVDKKVSPGDVIVALGGRTGRDGIHGATFSSEALHQDSDTVDAAAVQIGDPITEKKVLDVLILARDRGLYSAVTDCGAGGFSSAVGEMGEECGAEVELSAAPLKYPGLSYWEIWVSEAQERMVLSVPPEHLDELLDLAATHEVGATVIGTFRDHRRLVLKWHGECVGDLPMDFLHGAVPQPVRRAENQRLRLGPTPWPAAHGGAEFLYQVLAHPACASKEWVVRQYDHEVQGGTVMKPYQGVDGRGPGDGTVVKPRLDLPQGVAIGCGIAPAVAQLDAYAGTALAIDEAIRNVVAAGGNPHRTALLDNFCWGDCRKADRLGSLSRAAEACYDAALAYGAPFISGKDSLNNEYRVGDTEVAIPPTLLCTAVAPVADTQRCPGTPLRRAGNILIQVGASSAAGGASVASELLDLQDSAVPAPDFDTAPTLFDALHQAIESGLVQSCHDLSEGGLGVAAAEMAFGAGLGLRLDLARVPVRGELGVRARLYSETPTRFLVEVEPDQVEDFGALFRTQPWATCGEVLAEATLVVLDGSQECFRCSLDSLLQANTCGR